MERGAGAALVVGLALGPAQLSAQDPAAIELTLRMPDPGRVLVEARFAAGHPFAEADGYRVLGAEPGGGWALQEAGAGPLGREVAVGPDGWVRVGVPLPDAAPPARTDLSFRAVIHPPPGYRIVDPFPSRVAEQEDGTVLLEVPAPPSLVRFRVVETGWRGLTAAMAADVAVGLVLALLVGVGVARVRRPSR